MLVLPTVRGHHADICFLASGCLGADRGGWGQEPTEPGGLATAVRSGWDRSPSWQCGHVQHRPQFQQAAACPRTFQSNAASL